MFPEASEWARHFEDLEMSMDKLLAQFFPIDAQLLSEWMRPGRYVSGPEFAEAGLAELHDLAPPRSAQGRK